ncbi:sensor histidine kinase [Rufibacter sediminis]|uniref:histidine kinase n=1 Tax=Rufibacter sediminis TaxID=2762756 RepID=A0ABR6VX34_9BACT|nr:HAMP domain-containing sensor histidine kinase [Rufibacter sediminis]MBC3541477.1 HAMP domain-containing histidine kinase [Rufibacter sediminis]
MRLQSKLALFSAASKIIILLLLVAGLPWLVNKVALINADARLMQKEDKMYQIIEEQGIESFLTSESGAYGSYNLFREEFISLEEISSGKVINSIENSLRKVDNQVVNYRVLSSTFDLGGKRYLLEIGRSLATIHNNSKTLQTYALYFLAAVVLLTVFTDLAFSKVLLRPLTLIIKRLQRVEHPSTFTPQKIKTSTSDFLYLNNTINAMMGQIQEAFQKEKEFIGNVSHELLTPVSILQTRLENLLSDPDTPESMLEKLVDNLRTLHRLKNIIQALLLISRIENEQYVRNEAVDIPQLAEEVAEEIKERAEAREVELKVDVTGEYTLAGNQSLLFTMLFNVVNNAIKYNKPEGSICLRGQPVAAGYELTVKDTGVGIQEEQLPHIFSRFKRLHAPDGESHGLGLTIVKTIATFHGIDLSVSSVPGEGTTFTFQFPKEV